MKYYFEARSHQEVNSFKGRYYEIVKGKTNFIKEFDFCAKDSDPVIICAYVCQLIAMGGNLPVILKKNLWAPPLVVFHTTVKDFWELKVWYDEALFIREGLNLEKLTNRLDELDLGKYKGEDKVVKLLEDTKGTVRDLHNYYKKRDKNDVTSPVVVQASVVKQFDFNKYK